MWENSQIFLLYFVFVVQIIYGELNSCELGSPFTLLNPLERNGCIERSEIKIIYIDHGGVVAKNGFWRLPRHGALRAAEDLGIQISVRSHESSTPDTLSLLKIIQQAIDEKPDAICLALTNDEVAAEAKVLLYLFFFLHSCPCLLVNTWKI